MSHNNTTSHRPAPMTTKQTRKLLKRSNSKTNNNGHHVAWSRGIKGHHEFQHDVRYLARTVCYHGRSSVDDVDVSRTTSASKIISLSALATSWTADLGSAKHGDAGWWDVMGTDCDSCKLTLRDQNGDGHRLFSGPGCDSPSLHWLFIFYAKIASQKLWNLQENDLWINVGFSEV